MSDATTLRTTRNAMRRRGGTSTKKLKPHTEMWGKITLLIGTLLQHPCRKNLEKIIGIILWATSMVHHTRFLLTSLYRDLYAIPATNCSIPPTQWEYFLSILNNVAIISIQNSLHLPLGAPIVEFKNSHLTSKSQLPTDIPSERHAWVFLMIPRKPCNGFSTLYYPSSHPSLSIATAILRPI